MIPKIIHCCWFGRNPKSKLTKKCIRSWKRYCRGYEIVEWNEDNYDISSAPLYVRQAYEAKKWAFVTDYVRLQVIYENGGIYLDTDVEMIRRPDKLLSCSAFFGFEGSKYIATGLGFGAEKGSPLLKELMDDYSDISFVLEDGAFDATTCPVRNTEVFVKHGLKADGTYQVLEDGIYFFPTEYFCPVKFGKITRKTFSVHHYLGSWCPPEEQASNRIYVERQLHGNRVRIKEYVRYLPKKITRFLLGEKRYEQLKIFLKGM